MVRPQEPILLPKLQIRFADFPYPRSFHGLEATHLGDLLRILVRSGHVALQCRAGLDFQGSAESTPDTPKSSGRSTSHTTLSPVDPIPG